MKTYEIPRSTLEGKTPICYGYKAVEWDGGTKQKYKYGQPGEELIGRAFTVDGDIVIKNSWRFTNEIQRPKRKCV